MKVTVQRIDRHGNAMLGSLTVSNGMAFRIRFSCLTLERADKLIAPGTYPLALTVSPKFSRKAGRPVKTPEIQGVASRSGLRIHVANYTRQLEGCIAPGYTFADLDKDGTIDVGESTKAYDALMDCLWPEGTESVVHTITIRDPRK